MASKRRRTCDQAETVRVSFQWNDTEYILKYLAGAGVTFRPLSEDSVFTKIDSDRRVFIVPGFGRFAVLYLEHEFVLNPTFGEATFIRPDETPVLTVETTTQDFDFFREHVVEPACKYHGVYATDLRGVKVYYNKYDEDWSVLSASAPTQDFVSMFLPDNIQTEIIRHLEEFQQQEARYVRFGRSFKTGIMLVGRPGMGKTTLVRTIAKHLNRSLYVLNLSRAKPENLEGLVQSIPPNSILVVDDIDSYYNGKEPKGSSGCQIPYSTFLNMLDGNFVMPHGLITFLTANDLRSLDSGTILRSGRIDRVFRFGDVTRAQFDRAFRAITESEEVDDALWAIIERRKLPMSTVMDILFYQHTSADRCARARDHHDTPVDVMFEHMYM